MSESWTPAEERAAKALAKLALPGIPVVWEELTERNRQRYLTQARTALSAAAEGEPEYQWGVRMDERRVLPCHDRGHAMSTRERLGGISVERRTVQRGPWEVVDGE